jgi:hypothetical protein
MKLRCPCGQVIADNTDNLPYKGRVIADQDWDKFTESQIRPIGHDPRLYQQIYQCPNCGRIQFEKVPGKACWFKPESADCPRDLLSSIGVS